MKIDKKYINKFNRLIQEEIIPYYRETIMEDDAIAPQDPNAPSAPMPSQDMSQQPQAQPVPQQQPQAEAPGFSPTQENDNINQETAQEEPNNEMGNDDDEKEKNIDKKNEEGLSDLKKTQKKVEDKIDNLSDKFERLMNKLDSLNKQIDDNSSHIESFKSELEKRNPTDIERLTLRSLQSGPFKETPKEYWDKKEKTSNYSVSADDNIENDDKYVIRQSDIDNANDWSNISKSFSQERKGLRDLLGY